MSWKNHTLLSSRSAPPRHHLLCYLGPGATRCCLLCISCYLPAILRVCMCSSWCVLRPLSCGGMHVASQERFMLWEVAFDEECVVGKVVPSRQIICVCLRAINNPHISGNSPDMIIRMRSMITLEAFARNPAVAFYLPVCILLHLSGFSWLGHVLALRASLPINLGLLILSALATALVRVLQMVPLNWILLMPGSRRCDSKNTASEPREMHVVWQYF